MKLIKSELFHPKFTVHAMSFIPEKIHASSTVAIFTHGYTTHKGDVLPWAARFVEADIPCIIFDLPGHYLGSFHELNNFSDFKSHAHELFSLAFDQLITQLNFSPKNILLAGHSLGALLALKALKLVSFSHLQRIAVGVGLGLSQNPHTHLFETSFFQKTLTLRRQLVSAELDSDNVFPWIKEEKKYVHIPNERIHLICGQDDVVVGAGGAQALCDILVQGKTQATLEEPIKLPHHEPGLAAAHLYAFYKKNYLN